MVRRWHGLGIEVHHHMQAASESTYIEDSDQERADGEDGFEVSLRQDCLSVSALGFGNDVRLKQKSSERDYYTGGGENLFNEVTVWGYQEEYPIHQSHGIRLLDPDEGVHVDRSNISWARSPHHAHWLRQMDL